MNVKTPGQNLLKQNKDVGAKNTFKHYTLNIAYCLWILYDLGSAK